MLFVIEDNMPGERFPLRIVHLTPHAGANLFLRTPVAADGTFQTQPFRSGNGHYLVHLPVHPALKKHGTLCHDIFRTELPPPNDGNHSARQDAPPRSGPPGPPGC